ncbi:hypothetical protein ACFUN8_08600 [Streptomyces sp. NPDC057307]|uniref:hypothetical protein n=1 Tax=Streptomyces sp. NPDC057307 TaxID=3346096 RepID=UPI0036274A61
MSHAAISGQIACATASDSAEPAGAAVITWYGPCGADQLTDLPRAFKGNPCRTNWSLRAR